MTCKCGVNSHDDQIKRFPVSSVVVAMQDILSPNGEVLVLRESKGFVGTHCDDGRAYFLFNDRKSAHTFHNPDEYVSLQEDLAQ